MSDVLAQPASGAASQHLSHSNSTQDLAMCCMLAWAQAAHASAQAAAHTLSSRKLNLPSANEAPLTLSHQGRSMPCCRAFCMYGESYSGSFACWLATSAMSLAACTHVVTRQQAQGPDCSLDMSNERLFESKQCILHDSSMCAAQPADDSGASHWPITLTTVFKRHSVKLRFMSEQSLQKSPA